MNEGCCASQFGSIALWDRAREDVERACALRKMCKYAQVEYNRLQNLDVEMVGVWVPLDCLLVPIRFDNPVKGVRYVRRKYLCALCEERRSPCWCRSVRFTTRPIQEMVLTQE